MLIKGENDVPFTILSVDPGTDTIGFAIVQLDLVSHAISVPYAKTLKTAQRRLLNEVYEQTHGTSHAKRQLIGKHVSQLLMRFSPHAIAVESPFLGRLVSAFESLVEVRAVLRSAVAHYDVTLALEMYSPPKVKNAVGVSGKSKDKSDMTRALAKLPLQWGDEVALDQLDEHSVDAVAVGYTKAQEIIKDYTE